MTADRLPRDLPATVAVEVEDGSVFQIELHEPPESLDDHSVLAALGDHWPPRGAHLVDKAEATPERYFRVSLGSPESMARFESDFGLYVAEKLEGYVAVHSALIRFDEVTVIFPGLSHTGKSTLSYAAREAGHQVLSDEYTLINLDTGMVTGWTRPIRRREADGSITRIPLADYSEEFSPTHVVDVRYDSQAEGLELTALGPGEIALSLLANTLCAQSRPEDSLRATASVARAARGARGTRGDVDQALPALQRWLRQDSQATAFD